MSEKTGKQFFQIVLFMFFSCVLFMNKTPLTTLITTLRANSNPIWARKVIKTRRVPTRTEPITDNEKCTSLICTKIRQTIFITIMERKFEPFLILSFKFFGMKRKQMLIMKSLVISDIKPVIFGNRLISFK